MDWPQGRPFSKWLAQQPSMAPCGVCGAFGSCTLLLINRLIVIKHNHSADHQNAQHISSYAVVGVCEFHALVEHLTLLLKLI